MPDAGPLIGAHMSVAGGAVTGIERALAVRARALQIFTKNASQWKGKPITDAEAAAFREAWAASGLAPVVAHDSYLINLASPDPALLQKSIEALADELLRCETLGVPFLVAHPGAHVGSGVLEGCDRVAASIDRARALAPAPSVILLLENVAGQGTTLGRKFEELARIRSGVSRRDLTQFCFDTCHAHAAGYDLTTEKGYEETFREFDAILGLESLRVFHVNDSKNERGSHVDRHEQIGKGKIGIEAFARLMRDPRFTAVPKLLETPKGADGVVMDRRNLALLRRLAEEPGLGDAGDEDDAG
ncbi:MAG TPA: deoxyribonuclease IV [Candidatus Eisenbacteria bacterium]|nr:deoxyribonuclease IV [Candidatus Eisenbacteria bacterium]